MVLRVGVYLCYASKRYWSVIVKSSHTKQSALITLTEPTFCQQFTGKFLSGGWSATIVDCLIIVPVKLGIRLGGFLNF